MGNRKQLLRDKLVTYTCTSCQTIRKLLSGEGDESNVKVDICSSCHPFYLGKLAFESVSGPAERLKKKFESGRAKYI